MRHHRLLTFIEQWRTHRVLWLWRWLTFWRAIVHSSTPIFIFSLAVRYTRWLNCVGHQAQINVLLEWFWRSVIDFHRFKVLCVLRLAHHLVGLVGYLRPVLLFLHDLILRSIWTNFRCNQHAREVCRFANHMTKLQFIILINVSLPSFKLFLPFYTRSLPHKQNWFWAFHFWTRICKLLCTLTLALVFHSRALQRQTVLVFL